MPIRINAGDQKLRIFAHHIFITIERQARLGERGEHPAVPSGKNFFVASRAYSLLADSIEMTLSARDEIGVCVHIANDMENVGAFPVAALRHIEQLTEGASFVLA